MAGKTGVGILAPTGTKSLTDSKSTFGMRITFKFENAWKRENLFIGTQSGNSSAMMSQEQVGFGEMLAEDLSASLKQMLGESAARALLYYLKVQNSVTNLDALAVNLAKTLGPGAMVVEKIIARSVYRRVNMRFDDSDQFDFVTCLNMVRSRAPN
jgi:hypothetical protein